MTAREKWGRIPAKILEIDQPFCRARWGEILPGRLGLPGDEPGDAPDFLGGAPLAASSGGGILVQRDRRVWLEFDNFTSPRNSTRGIDFFAQTRDGNRTTLTLTAEYRHASGAQCRPIELTSPSSFLDLSVRVIGDDVVGDSNAALIGQVTVPGLVPGVAYTVFVTLIQAFDSQTSTASYTLTAGFCERGGAVTSDSISAIASPAQNGFNHAVELNDFGPSRQPLQPVALVADLQVWGRALTNAELASAPSERGRNRLMSWWLWGLDRRVCRASIGDNYVGNSSSFSPDAWDITGSATRFPNGDRQQLDESILLPTATVTQSESARHVFRAGAIPDQLYLEIEYTPLFGEQSISVELGLRTVAGAVAGAAIVSYDTDAHSLLFSATAVDISNVEIPDSGGWRRVRFRYPVPPSVVDGAEAVTARVRVNTSSGGQVFVARPSISTVNWEPFAPTFGVPKVGRQTDDDRCFQTIATCGFPQTYQPDPLTLRYVPADQADAYPVELRATPSLIGVQHSPGVLNVGGVNESVSPMGRRAVLNAAIKDHPSSDLELDPYRNLRSYDPMKQGTYWGKWLARNEYRENLPVRARHGYLEGGKFVEQDVYYYLLDKVDGPNGSVQLQAMDLLQALRSDRAVFPASSPGRLAEDISDTAASFELSPVGIGAEYPAEFRCRIGGEGMDVERVGDVCTIIQRDLYGGAESHSEDDQVQVVAQMSGQVHDIAYEIITTAIPQLIPMINKAAWDSVARQFLPRIYAADITEPTGVEKLIGELVVTAPVYWYADIRRNQIIMDAIREQDSVSLALDDDAALIGGSVDVKTYPRERVDEVVVSYRMRDPAGKPDDEDNYSQRFILINPMEQERRGGQRSIKRLFSRWIVAGAREAAEEIARAYISRFQSTPVKIAFDLDASKGDLWLGDIARIITRKRQKPTGAPEDGVSYQVVQAHEAESGRRFSYLAQSFEYVAPLTLNTITIRIQPEDTVKDGSVSQIDLRELYDATVASEFANIEFIFRGGPLPTGGTVAGSQQASGYSVRVPNNWPWGPTITLRVEPGAAVVGHGGRGGDGGGGDFGSTNLTNRTPGSPGGDGGDALIVEYPGTILDNAGIIPGGAGGGGGGAGGGFRAAGAGGGGGAGRVAGGRGISSASVTPFTASATQSGQAGSLTSGGAGGQGVINGVKVSGNGGRGGDLGQPGQPGQSTTAGSLTVPGGAGGQPGRAIVGISNCVVVQLGDVRGEIV